MSTQANFLNLSDRGGILDISRTSHRENPINLGGANAAASSNIAANAKKIAQAGVVPNLLPIDEDVDDEKCSPIKPKKRTAEDSPFKKHFAKQASMRSGKQERDGEPVLVISSEEDAVVDIAVGGFGIELDQNVNLGNNNGDVSSLNLNSGIMATPPQKNNMSSPLK